MTRLAEYADLTADIVPAFRGDTPTYAVNAAAFDRRNSEAIFFATFLGFRESGQKFENRPKIYSVCHNLSVFCTLQLTFVDFIWIVLHITCWIGLGQAKTW